MRRLASDSVIYGLGSVANQALAILLLPLYTRYLTPADYGSVALIGAAGGVISLLAALGVSSGLTRIYYLFEGEEERRTVVFTAFVFALVAAGLTCAALLASSHWLSPLLFDFPEGERYLRLAGVAYALSAVNGVSLGTLQVQQRPRVYVTCSALGLLTSMSLSIWLVAFRGRGVDGVLEGQLAGMAVQLGLTSLAIAGRLRPRWNALALRDMLAFSIPLLPTNVAAWGLGLADRWFLKTYGSYADVGLYALGYRFGAALDMLLVSPFTLAWFPYLYSITSQPDHREICARVLEYYTVIAATLVLGLSLFGGDVIHVIADPSFQAADRVIFWIGLGILFRGMIFITITGINIERKNHWSPLVYLPGVALNLGLLRVLVPRFGMMGAAISTVITFLAINLAFYAISQRLYPIPYRPLKIAHVLAVLCGVETARRFVPADPWPLALALKAGLMLGFVALLFATRFFSAADLGRLRTVVQRLRTA